VKRKIFKLPKDLLIGLKKLKGIKVFRQNEDFLPEHEIPNSTLIILEGRVSILKNDSEFLEVSPGYGLAFDDLNLRAKNTLKVIVLDPEDFRSGSPVRSLFQRFFGRDLLATT
jgi:hypothetical protein